MTGAEAKAALISGEPVELDGVTYERIQQIVYNRCRDGISVSAVLVDRTGRSTTTALVRNVNRISEHSGGVEARHTQTPIESIELRTYAGTLLIEIVPGECGQRVAERGEWALPPGDAPYHVNDTALETMHEIVGRIRDTAHTVIGDWHEARGLDRYTGEPISAVSTYKKE